MIGAAELGIIGIIILGIWAAISGLIDGKAYEKYQKEKEEQERKRNNWR